jgi:hypothetical protein
MAIRRRWTEFGYEVSSDTPLKHPHKGHDTIVFKRQAVEWRPGDDLKEGESVVSTRPRRIDLGVWPLWGWVFFDLPVWLFGQVRTSWRVIDGVDAPNFIRRDALQSMDDPTVLTKLPDWTSYWGDKDDQ